MPTLAITLSADATTKLQALVDTYNASTGESLSIQQWVIQDLKRKIIARDFATEMAAINAAVDADRTTQLEAALQTLVDALATDLT